MWALCLKVEKTGKPIPIYLVNLLLRANFEQIYEMKELCCVRIFMKVIFLSNAMDL